VRLAAPILVRVLGDVEELREVREGAHHAQRILDRQRVQPRLELGLDLRGLLGRRAPEAHRRLPDRFDALARRLALLLGDHVPEQPPEQAAILAEELLLVVGRIPDGCVTPHPA